MSLRFDSDKIDIKNSFRLKKGDRLCNHWPHDTNKDMRPSIRVGDSIPSSLLCRFEQTSHYAVLSANLLAWRLCKSSWSSRWCVSLLDQKPGLESQAKHQNEIWKVFRFFLSRFLAKTLRVNKNCHEKFPKKSVVRCRI